MKLWVLPIAVLVLVTAIVAAFALLDPGAAFVVVAVLFVCGIGAAPVVFAVLSRRRESGPRDPNEERTPGL